MNKNINRFSELIREDCSEYGSYVKLSKKTGVYRTVIGYWINEVKNV